MKKISAVFFALALSLGVMAGEYRLNESSIETSIAQAEDVTMSEVALYESFTSNSISSASMQGGDQARGGYLVRAAFCGSFGIHRYYMGSTGAKFFFLYACVPVVGNVAVCVDFWSVVFDAGKLGRYKGSDKYLVWVD